LVGQELGEDHAAGCAEGFANADLSGPLGDRDEHDVGDDDAADQGVDRGDRTEQERERLGSVGLRL
jgi:hypothetical protein